MKSILFGLLVLTASIHAQARIELGLGAGHTFPVANDDFRKSGSTGNSNQYWIGTSITDQWSVGVQHSNLDFDSVNMESKVNSLVGIYRWRPGHQLHPLAILGLGMSSTKFASGADGKSGAAAQAAFGVEYDTKFVSMGLLASYYYMDKTSPDRSAQAATPSLFVNFHDALSFDGTAVEKKSQPVAVAAAAVAATPVVIAADGDGDGVNDENDKCPGTPSGLAVNKLGCSVKEKAQVKIQVEFAPGKSVVTEAYVGEIQKLAEFMKAHPETSVVIAGHTDNTGNEKGNLAISKARAEAVAAKVISFGVEKNRVSAVGYGSKEPIADNKTLAGRQQNRRVMADLSVESDKKK